MKIEKQKLNLRKTQAEERRQQILDTALTVFARNGFEGSSIKDIAQEAGISQGLMYHYFASKTELLDATVECFSFLPQLRQILSDTRKLPLSEVFEDIARSFLDLLDARGDLISILIQQVNSNPDVAHAWANLCQEGVSVLQNYLEGYIARGDLRPHNTEVTARSLFATIFMYHFTRNVFHSSRVTRSQFIEEVLKNTLYGIGKE